jgi:hypothetical protein
MSTIVYGWQEEVFAAAEASYGVPAFPTGSDAFRAISTDFPFDQPRRYREDKQSSGRDYISRITGRKEGRFSVLKNVIPSGTPGTYPDAHLLWKSAFGSAASGNGSCVYSLLESTNPSLTILRVAGPMSEAIYGAVVDEVRVTTGGGQNAQALFSGFYKDRIVAGTSSLAANVATGGVTLTLGSGEADKYSPGARVVIGGSENAMLSSVNATDSQLVLSSGVAAGHPTGASVTPYKPTASTSGQPIYGISGGVLLGGSAVKVISSQIALSNRLRLRNDEYGSDSASGVVHPDRRIVTFQHQVHLGADQLVYVRRSERFAAQPMTHTIGGNTGSRVGISIPHAEFDIISPQIPETEEAVLTVKGVGLGSGGNDPISIKFY